MEVEVQLYSFFISALDGVGGSRQVPAALPPGMTQYPLYRRLGRPQHQSGQVQKNFPAPEFDPRTVQPQQVAIPTELSQPFDIHTGFLFYRGAMN